MRLVLFYSSGIFFARNVDETYDFLDWLAWDSYEFETSYSNSYIPDPASVIMPLLCVKFAMALIMIVVLVPIIFLLMVLLGL